MQRLDDIMAVLMARDKIWVNTPVLGSAMGEQRRNTSRKPSAKSTVLDMSDTPLDDKGKYPARDTSPDHSQEPLGFITRPRTNQSKLPLGSQWSRTTQRDRPINLESNDDDDNHERGRQNLERFRFDKAKATSSPPTETGSAIMPNPLRPKPVPSLYPLNDVLPSDDDDDALV